MFGLTRKLNRLVYVGLMHLSCLQWNAEFGARMHWDERWINSIRELQSFWGPALRLTNCNKEFFFSHSVRQTAKLVFFLQLCQRSVPGRACEISTCGFRKEEKVESSFCCVAWTDKTQKLHKFFGENKSFYLNNVFQNVKGFYRWEETNDAQ